MANITVTNPFACLEPISSHEDITEDYNNNLERKDNILATKAANSLTLTDTENNSSYTPTNSSPRNQSNPSDKPLEDENAETKIEPQQLQEAMNEVFGEFKWYQDWLKARNTND